MALSLLPDRLAEERLAQAKARDQRLAGALELLQRYPGPWWQGAISSTGSVDAENAAFEYVSHQMSQDVWANPRWRVSTKRPRAQQMVAQAIDFGANRWTQDSDFKTVLEDICVDRAFAWGVGHVSPQPREDAFEAEDPILWPQATRLSPWDFGFDNRAKTWRQARMLWHDYSVDRMDTLKRAREDRRRPEDKREGWDYNALLSLPATSRTSARHRTQQEGPDRDELKLSDIWIPGVRLDGEPGPEDGFNGVICTISEHATGAIHVREPRPFFGPRWGPYTVFGTYIVPDSPYPLSLLLAVAGLIDQSSRLSKAVDQQVEAYKRLLLVGAQDNQLAQTIRDGKSDHVHFARGIAELDRFVREYEIGGTTPGNVAAEQRSIGKRNRMMGLDEVQRGHVTGEGTATEVQLAVEASMGRQGYVKGKFQDGARRMGKTVCWYLYHTDEIEFPLGPEAVEEMGFDPMETEALFRGGDFRDGSGATFDDLGLEIEAHSMERPSEAFLRQRGEFVANLVQLAPAFAQAGQLGGDVKALLDAFGDAFGMPQASRLFPGIESADLSVIQPEQAGPRLGRMGYSAGRVTLGGAGMARGPGGAGRAVSPNAFAG